MSRTKWALVGAMVIAWGTSRAADVDPAPSDDEIRSAIVRAVDLLVGNQENYESDPPVGTLPAAELEKWQAEERARLSKLREATAGAAREWPYEGVYRVTRRGIIPP
ncbi:MAG: hypothetical protein KDC38_05775, partial [Planctomycetes bacterium]|nr:hypothetical protein [Planctomycetota bacterium]